MAAVEHPTTAMNGDIKFTIGAVESADEAYDMDSLQQEVIVNNSAQFKTHLVALQSCMDANFPMFICMFFFEGLCLRLCVLLFRFSSSTCSTK